MTKKISHIKLRFALGCLLIIIFGFTGFTLIEMTNVVLVVTGYSLLTGAGILGMATSDLLFKFENQKQEKTLTKRG